ncbi:dihydroneopterin aldolase [uncultured Halovibrio sp.]|uniref:dihydroneopterin aldolase n=1 Tax=uncultured Halovibrio sp. TaxID=985049 RepID=UPI0025FCA6BD|nr:dihydroneopterin aldolase [uncultured Halovibrio sp.]
MDSVFIERLAVDAVIGVLDWERAVTQRLLVDLDLRWDNRAPAAGDDLTLALDYAAVSEAVAQCLREGRFRLLETAAERLAAMIADDFGVGYRRIVLRKPGAVPGAEAVGVVVERGEGE